MAVLLMMLGLMAGCAEPEPTVEPTVEVPEAYVAALQKIPPAQPQLYTPTPNPQDWKNPILMVRKNGVDLLPDPDWNPTKTIPLANLAEALAALPKSAWPYGRVVAVPPEGIGSPGDAAMVDKTVGQVLEVLKKLGVEAARGWPSA